MTADTGETSTYLLGHADDEVQRLLLQGKLYNIYTDSALRVAGLQPGMSVLDVGCGPGDTSLSAARLVGPTGTVVGVDANPEILELARRRAAESGMSTVSFEQATIPDVSIHGPFDAVIGRLILMHLPEPAEALRHLATLVRPGGLIAFQEFDISMGRSVPELPRFTMLVDLIVRTCHGVGLSTEFGTCLYGLFQEAGLPAPSMTLGAATGGAANFADGFKYLVDVWRMLLPVADQLGLVTDEVSDLDALLTCLRDEATSNNAVITGPSLVSAWTTVTMFEGR